MSSRPLDVVCAGSWVVGLFIWNIGFCANVVSTCDKMLEKASFNRLLSKSTVPTPILPSPLFWKIDALICGCSDGADGADVGCEDGSGVGCEDGSGVGCEDDNGELFNVLCVVVRGGTTGFEVWGLFVVLPLLVLRISNLHIGHRTF